MKEFDSHNYLQSLHQILRKSIYSAMIFAVDEVYLIKFLSHNKILKQFDSHNYLQLLHQISRKSLYNALIFAAEEVYLIKFL